MVRGERLDQARLQVRADAVHDDLDRLQVAARGDDVDGALLAAVLTRRHARLHRVGDPGQDLPLLLGRQRPELLLVVPLPGDDVLHDAPVQDAAERVDVRDPGIVLEPGRVREAAPRECELRLERARDDGLDRRHRRPLDVLVLLEVERLPLQLAEDRLRRAVGRRAAEHREHLDRVDARLVLLRDADRRLGGRGHVRGRRRDEQACLGERFVPGLPDAPHPRRLAARVDVVTAGRKRSLDHGVAVVDARPGGVADDLRAPEELRQLVDRVLDLDDLVVGGADPGHVVEHVLDPRPVAAGRDERDVVLAQELDDEAAREAARAVDDDRSPVRHARSPCRWDACGSARRRRTARWSRDPRACRG